MPPSIKRNCQVILYDLNTIESELTKRCLLKYYCRKLFTQSKNLYKLILINSKTTSNRLNSRYNNEYLGIYETMDTPLMYNDPKSIETIIENAEIGESNWLEALYVGFKSLTEDFQGCGTLITLQLILLTDFIKQTSNQTNRLLQTILDEFNQTRIFLYIIGPNTTPPFIIKDIFFINNWMRNLTIPTINQETFEIIQQLITKLDRCVCCNYKIGLNLLETYKNFNGRQTWNVPLSIGDKLEFVSQTRRILKQEMLCKIVKKRKYFKQTIWVDIEDSSIKYAPDDIITGIERHGKFVPIIDNKRFKCETNRDFTICGFYKSTNIPEHYMRGDGSYYVVPYGYKRPLEVLIDCMAHRDMVMIARRVYATNYNAKYVLLIPKVDPKCLILTDLPYSYETRRYHYKELPVEQCEIYQNTIKNDLIHNFLDSISCKNSKVIERIPLNIDLIQDPNTERIINKATDKYLEKHLQLDEFDLDYLNINLINNSNMIDKLKQIWPKRELRTSNGKTKQQCDKEIDENMDDFDF